MNIILTTLKHFSVNTEVGKPRKDVSEILARNCTENEEYNTCVTGCTKYCGNIFDTSCSWKCVEGCECKAGYVRKYRGSNECILESQCSTPKCPPNQIYNPCGPVCPDYCGKPDDIACCLLPYLAINAR
nr:zonadhesin-like [Onthophagus taurus]